MRISKDFYDSLPDGIRYTKVINGNQFCYYAKLRVSKYYHIYRDTNNGYLIIDETVRVGGRGCLVKSDGSLYKLL